jgi:hypothetical protein
VNDRRGETEKANDSKDNEGSNGLCSETFFRQYNSLDVRNQFKRTIRMEMEANFIRFRVANVRAISIYFLKNSFYKPVILAGQGMELHWSLRIVKEL